MKLKIPQTKVLYKEIELEVPYFSCSSEKANNPSRRSKGIIYRHGYISEDDNVILQFHEDPEVENSGFHMWVDKPGQFNATELLENPGTKEEVLDAFKKAKRILDQKVKYLESLSPTSMYNE